MTSLYHHILFLTVFSLSIVSAEAVQSGVAVQNPVQTSEDNVAYLDYLLDLRVTSGSFLELDLETSPFSMTIITREQVRLCGARTMSELLEIHVPGFQYMFNKWNGTIWGMRGVANDRNTKMIYLVNGHKLNTQARDGFQSETVLGLLGDIERVEVLRGPAGLVYGSGAIAGIVNVVTRKAEGNGADVGTAFTTSGGREFDANIFAVPSTDQTISIAAGFRQSDGLDDHASRIYGSGPYPLPSSSGNDAGVPADGNYGSTDGNWRIAGEWGIKNLNLYLRATRQKENAGAWFVLDPWPERTAYPDSTFPPKLVDGEIIYYDDPFWRQTESYFANRQQYLSDNLSGEARYDHPLGVNDLQLKAGCDRTTTRTATEPREGYTGDYLGINADFLPFTFGETRISTSALFMLKSVPGLQLAAGFEYRLDIIGDDMEGHNQAFRHSFTPVVTGINYHTFSLFTEGMYALSDKLDLHFGGRLDRHTRAFMATPKLALIYKPARRHALKFICQSSSNNGSADNYEYNRFHRDLNTGDLSDTATFLYAYLHPAVNSEIVQPVQPLDSLHTLRPERVYSAELAYTGGITDRITLAPSASFGYVKDLFGWSQKLFRVVNAGSYRYFNLDLEGDYRGRYVAIGVNHTFQRPVFTDVEKQKTAYPIVTIDTSGVYYDSVPSAVSPTGWEYRPRLSGNTAGYDVNLVKDGVTADGRAFLNLNTNITKCHLTFTPYKWMALHANVRLFWGLRGRHDLHDADAGFNYLDIADGPADHGLYNYLKRSVSKKVNASIHFFLPHGFDAAVFAYDIFGIDRPFDPDMRNYTINAIRWAHMFSPAEKELFSTDRRTFGIRLGKTF